MGAVVTLEQLAELPDAELLAYVAKLRLSDEIPGGNGPSAFKVIVERFIALGILTEPEPHRTLVDLFYDIVGAAQGAIRDRAQA